MNLFTGLVVWCILLVLAWPVALLVVVLWPVVWVLSLGLRLVAVVVEAIVALLLELLLLPARLLGYRGRF